MYYLERRFLHYNSYNNFVRIKRIYVFQRWKENLKVFVLKCRIIIDVPKLEGKLWEYLNMKSINVRSLTNKWIIHYFKIVSGEFLPCIRNKKISIWFNKIIFKYRGTYVYLRTTIYVLIIRLFNWKIMLLNTAKITIRI